MIHAVIFDLDGTVLDNEGVWEQAIVAVAKNNNIPFELTSKWLHEPGIGIKNNWKKIISGDYDLDRLTAETHALYRDITAMEEIKVREGLVTLVENIKEQGLKTALATGSEWHAVENQLVQLDLYLAFDVTTTGDEVLAIKPDPEIYLLTVQKLGLEPSECLVIEDAIAGIEAGRDAGCRTVGLVSDRVTAPMLKAAGANYVIDSLEEIMLILREDGNKASQKSEGKSEN